MKYVGIIWNRALPYEEEILKFISDNSHIIDTFILHLGDSFKSFVRQIYSTDGIADWKVTKKLDHMCRSSIFDVRIVIFDMEMSEQFYHSTKKTYVYAKPELLKCVIRINVMTKIPDYFFDIAFHSSDTEEQFDSNMQIIEQYK